MSNELKRSFVRWAMAPLAGILLAAVAWGQFTTSIEGTVTDPSGSAIPGAAITLLNTETGIKTTVQTNSTGYFVFPSLPPRLFSGTAAGPGFRSGEVSAVAPAPG